MSFLGESAVVSCEEGVVKGDEGARAFVRDVLRSFDGDAMEGFSEEADDFALHGLGIVREGVTLAAVMKRTCLLTLEMMRRGSMN